MLVFSPSRLPLFRASPHATRPISHRLGLTFPRDPGPVRPIDAPSLSPVGKPVITHPPYRYQLHGLTLASELEFPELPRADEGTVPDLFLRQGDVPARLEPPCRRGACHEARPGEMLLWLEGVARFHVMGGRELVLAAEEGASAASLRRLVLSSPLAAVLLQRGLLPLRASAISTPKGAVVFPGGACLGKSTLAAEFQRRGFPLLSDGVTALKFTAGETPVVVPGYPQLRLWPDAVAAVGGNPAVLPRMRPELDKRILDCSGSFEIRSMPLAAIYFLDRREADTRMLLSRLEGAQRVAGFMDTIHRLGLTGLGVQERVFLQVAELARTARLARLIQPAGGFVLKPLADAVMEDLGL